MTVLLKFNIFDIHLQYVQLCDLCVPVNSDDGKLYCLTHL